MAHQSGTRYGTVAQSFHWATAILVLIAFIFGPGGSELRVYLPGRDFERQLHESLGLCVLALVLLRLLLDQRPEAPQMARWMAIAAKAMQGALYLLLFAVPLTAIAGAWLEGHPLTLLAGVEIPSLIGKSHAVGGDDCSAPHLARRCNSVAGRAPRAGRALPSFPAQGRRTCRDAAALVPLEMRA